MAPAAALLLAAVAASMTAPASGQFVLAAAAASIVAPVSRQFLPTASVNSRNSPEAAADLEQPARVLPGEVSLRRTVKREKDEEKYDGPTELPSEEARWLQQGIRQMRGEVKALEEQRHSLISEFGRRALVVDNLYTEAQQEVTAQAENLRLSQRVCNQLTSCADCARAPVCGWCAVENTCVPGDRLGAFAGLAASTACNTYRFGTCDAVSCAARTRCDDCLGDEDCGWCSSSKLCFAGDARGPKAASCPAVALARNAGPTPWVHAAGKPRCPVQAPEQDAPGLA